MLSLYDILKTARTGITPSLWNMAAARAFFGENAMTEIAAEAFSGSPVNAVKLPEGMEVIR